MIRVVSRNGKALKRTSEEDQNTRWMEHFKEVLNQPDPLSYMNFTNEEVLDTLEVNTNQIIEDEVDKAIACLNDKTPGVDKNSAETWEEKIHRIVDTPLQYDMSGRRKMFLKTGEKGPYMIVNLLKKGDLSNLQQLERYTLLSVPGMVFCAILLNRLKDGLNTRLIEEQAGFRSGRSCSEQILILRNNQKLFINFDDCKKVFDSVRRETVWIAEVYGIPQRVIQHLQELVCSSCC